MGSVAPKAGSGKPVQHCVANRAQHFCGRWDRKRKLHFEPAPPIWEGFIGSSHTPLSLSASDAVCPLQGKISGTVGPSQKFYGLLLPNKPAPQPCSRCLVVARDIIIAATARNEERQPRNDASRPRNALSSWNQNACPAP